jgi:hypothetical protein
MSTKKKGKSKAAAKQKRTVPATAESAVAVRDAASANLSGHWTIPINPHEAALIAQTLRPCHLVIQNHGPGEIWLVAGDGDLMDLPAGNLRATYVRGTLTVEVRDDKPALIELEFFPVFFKN